MIDIASVTLAVRDLDRVARFYRDAIGLTEMDFDSDPDGDTLWLGVDGHKLLELLHRPKFDSVDRASAGLHHTAFLLPTRADLGRWLRHAAALNLEIDGAADHLVSEAIYLADPEGNGIEIYADRPRNAWRWQGTEIIMANDRLDLQALMKLDPAPWSGAPSGTTIGHVHLQVGDLATAAPFYAATLGFDVTRRQPQALFLSTGGYHHHLAVNTWHSAGASPREPARAGLARITLRTDELTSRPPNVLALTDPWGTQFSFGNGNTP